jgi:hypothetical protein
VSAACAACTPQFTGDDCDQTNALPLYFWKAGAWGECSQRCGSGTSLRTAACMVATTLDLVAPAPNATLCDPFGRPVEQAVCNDFACGLTTAVFALGLNASGPVVTASSDTMRAFTSALLAELAAAVGQSLNLPASNVTSSFAIQLLNVTSDNQTLFQFELLPPSTASASFGQVLSALQSVFTQESLDTWAFGGTYLRKASITALEMASAAGQVVNGSTITGPLLLMAIDSTQGPSSYASLCSPNLLTIICSLSLSLCGCFH